MAYFLPATFLLVILQETISKSTLLIFPIIFLLKKFCGISNVESVKQLFYIILFYYDIGKMLFKQDVKI